MTNGINKLIFEKYFLISFKMKKTNELNCINSNFESIQNVLNRNKAEEKNKNFEGYYDLEGDKISTGESSLQNSKPLPDVDFNKTKNYILKEKFFINIPQNSQIQNKNQVLINSQENKQKSKFVHPIEDFFGVDKVKNKAFIEPNSKNYIKKEKYFEKVFLSSRGKKKNNIIKMEKNKAIDVPYNHISISVSFHLISEMKMGNIISCCYKHPFTHDTIFVNFQIKDNSNLNHNIQKRNYNNYNPNSNYNFINPSIGLNYTEYFC